MEPFFYAFLSQNLTNEFSNNNLPILEILTRCSFHPQTFDFFRIHFAIHIAMINDNKLMIRAKHEQNCNKACY